MVRSDDVTADNTVLSYNVADATIRSSAKAPSPTARTKAGSPASWTNSTRFEMPLVPRHLNPRSRRIVPRCRGFRRRKAQAVPAAGQWVLRRKSVRQSFCLSGFLLAAFAVSADGVRVRDLVMVAGARDNQLVGYGLVAGLAGEGDKDPIYTKQTMANMLQRYGINIPATTLSSKNVAVVMVTADIPAFIKPGARLDVQVSSMGDAKSLARRRAVADALARRGQQGLCRGARRRWPSAVSPPATAARGGATVTKNHPTTGTIINGALVEREIPATSCTTTSVELLLRDPDFTSAALHGRGHQRRVHQLAPTRWTPPPSGCGCPTARRRRRWISSRSWKTSR